MRQTKARRITELVLAVFRLNGTLVEWGDGFSAPEGLTSSRWQMLGALALAGRPLTAPQVAAGMGVTRQGAQKQLNLLVRDGLVETCANPRHKRSPLFAPTERGSRVYAAVERRWNEHVVGISGGFSGAELETAAAVLAGLAAAHAYPGDDDEA